ncbi:hypothetical protein NSND_60255 [Nitrospira sp. ND1]|nr:hypothetical protein NSND_60255 [Nitrospira sp. ND1]
MREFLAAGWLEFWSYTASKLRLLVELWKLKPVWQVELHSSLTLRIPGYSATTIVPQRPLWQGRACLSTA